MSGVRRPVSCVLCNFCLGEKFQIKKDNMVELVGGGSVINGVTPSSFSEVAKVLFTEINCTEK